MTANQMRLAAKIVGGEPIADTIDSGDGNEMGDDDDGGDDGNNFERLYVSDSDDDSFSAIDMDRKNRLQKARDLMYNDSDDESERSANITASKNRATTSTSASAQDSAFDMMRNGNDDEMDRNEQTERVDQMELSGFQEDNDASNVEPAIQFDSEDFNSQVIRRRLAELDDSDGGDSDDNDAGNYQISFYCF